MISETYPDAIYIVFVDNPNITYVNAMERKLSLAALVNA